MAWVIALALTALLAAWAGVIHHRLRQLRAVVSQAWAGLDALLLERRDELAAFAAACSRHLPEEQDGIERLQRASAAVFAAAGRRDLPALGAAESLLQDAQARLSASAATSQKLLADADCRERRERLGCIQRALAEQREVYNAAVNLLNLRQQQFPERLVARALRLQAGTALEFAPARPAT
jgi:LemA protein